jgi:hypothetical protein
LVKDAVICADTLDDNAIALHVIRSQTQTFC